MKPWREIAIPLQVKRIQVDTSLPSSSANPKMCLIQDAYNLSRQLEKATFKSLKDSGKMICSTGLHGQKMSFFIIIKEL